MQLSSCLKLQPSPLAQSARRAALALLALVLSGWLRADDALTLSLPPPDYDVILGRPTDTSVAVSVLARETDLEVHLTYGAVPGAATGTTMDVVARVGEPAMVTLADLPVDQNCYYRVWHRPLGGEAFHASPEWSFHTQRRRGSGFVFAIEADPHYRDNDPLVWQQTLANVVADAPDFLIDLGDTFMDEKFGASSLAGIRQTRSEVRAGFFGRSGHSVPLFLVNGNHDPELGWLLRAASPQENLAVWGVRAHEQYFPSPLAGSFYSGATESDPFAEAPRSGYYAFEWGDALFVMLDPYWYTAQASRKAKDPWSWTLGRAQYDWLQRTLSQSTAPFIFVFLHQLVGGSFDGQGRGGVELAAFFEWGGSNADGSEGFAAHRPGWAMPIQDLLLAHHVSAVFHGHDHLYVRQPFDSDGDGTAELIYQEVPQPSRRDYDNTRSAAGYGYTHGTLLGSSGHLRVQVAPSSAVVEYVRAYRSEDQREGRTNRMVADRYTLAPRTQSAPFAGNVILGRPTASSVTASIVSAAELEGYVEYGSVADGFALSTEPIAWPMGAPVEVLLDRLPANASCCYRLRYRSSATKAFELGEERYFQTQRAPGESFIFCIQGDSHPERSSQFDPELYRRTLLTAAADAPDFYLTMGDDFSVDTLPSITRETVAGRYELQRPFLGLIAGRAPLFLVNGNHEQAAAYLLDGTTDNVAVWAQTARNRWYPQPVPDDFYSGDTVPVAGIGLLRDYSAWTWGDALFVVIDPYWHSPVPVDNALDGAKTADRWELTLGETQYRWLERTLAESRATHKFVFAHHVNGTGRGGIEQAAGYEWGGENADGSWGFAQHRPGWPAPIHQLMAATGVTLFFQGHDHVFARQELDGVTYQTLPEPADPNYSSFYDEAYRFGDKLPNTGYVRVTVSPEAVQVEYVRTFLLADENVERINGSVAYRYVLPARQSESVQ